MIIREDNIFILGLTIFEIVCTMQIEPYRSLNSLWTIFVFSLQKPKLVPALQKKTLSAGINLCPQVWYDISQLPFINQIMNVILVMKNNWMKT